MGRIGTGRQVIWWSSHGRRLGPDRGHWWSTAAYLPRSGVNDHGTVIIAEDAAGRTARAPACGRMTGMRILVAPDKFAGTLTATEAAEAIRDGWARTARGDEFHLVPLSDGGPGFLEVLHVGLGGELLVETVRGPLGAPTPAPLLRVDDTAYVEVAQACGLHLVEPEHRDALAASSYGVGQLLAAAAEAGARRIVVGVGGTATSDGG